MRKFFVRFDQGLESFSRFGIVLCLVLILTLAVGAIVLRWMGIGLTWIDPLVRHLVFVSAFFGGSLATSSNQHIRVDLLTKLVERSPLVWVHWIHRKLISLFCLATVIGLVASGAMFYQVEKEFGSPGLLGIHSSHLVAIIPWGMGLIALRFFNQLFIEHKTEANP